jgi:hypothetical protein
LLSIGGRFRVTILIIQIHDYPIGSGKPCLDELGMT